MILFWLLVVIGEPMRNKKREASKNKQWFLFFFFVLEVALHNCMLHT